MCKASKGCFTLMMLWGNDSFKAASWGNTAHNFYNPGRWLLLPPMTSDDFIYTFSLSDWTCWSRPQKPRKASWQAQTSHHATPCSKVWSIRPTVYFQLKKNMLKNKLQVILLQLWEIKSWRYLYGFKTTLQNPILGGGEKSELTLMNSEFNLQLNIQDAYIWAGSWNLVPVEYR